jgi:hypothetical protein
MRKVEAIERQIESLSPAKLSAFRRWFASFDSRVWDRELKDDTIAGKLDALADEALEEHRGGKTSSL